MTRLALTRLALTLLLLCATATARPTAKPAVRRTAPATATARPEDSKAREAAIAKATELLQKIISLSQAQQAELADTKSALLESSVNETKLAAWSESEHRRADAEQVRADKEAKARVAAEKAYHRIKWPLCGAGAALAVFVCLQFGLLSVVAAPWGYWLTGGAAIAVFGALAVWL